MFIVIFLFFIVTSHSICFRLLLIIFFAVVIFIDFRHISSVLTYDITHFFSLTFSSLTIFLYLHMTCLCTSWIPFFFLLNCCVAYDAYSVAEFYSLFFSNFYQEKFETFKIFYIVLVLLDFFQISTSRVFTETCFIQIKNNESKAVLWINSKYTWLIGSTYSYILLKVFLWLKSFEGLLFVQYHSCWFIYTNYSYLFESFVLFHSLFIKTHYTMKLDFCI